MFGDNYLFQHASLPRKFMEETFLWLCEEKKWTCELKKGRQKQEKTSEVFGLTFGHNVIILICGSKCYNFEKCFQCYFLGTLIFVIERK